MSLVPPVCLHKGRLNQTGFHAWKLRGAHHNWNSFLVVIVKHVDFRSSSLQEQKNPV